MNKLLAIDTSTECASVALMVNGVILSEEQGAQRQHARLLLPMIEKLLAEAGLSLNQLDAIAYGRGPGSFTGLRIACSVAKGLAYARELPLFPVSSLAAIAYQARQQEDFREETAVLAVMDARMNQVYWACFPAENPVAEEQVSDAGELQVAGSYPLILAGVGYAVYKPQFSAELDARIIRHFSCYPKAEAMIQLVLSAKIAPVTAAEALPVYIRNKITQGESGG